MMAIMRGGMSFVHVLSVGWTLISVLIVSSSPNRSSSLSVPGTSPISLGEGSHRITSFQKKITDSLSPSSSSSSSSFSMVITKSNQFSSMFSSFTILQRDEPSFKKLGSGDRGSIISTNRPPLQLTFLARRPMVFNSAIDDTDKSDNQISSRIVPVPPAGSRTNKTNQGSDVNMPKTLQTDKDGTGISISIPSSVTRSTTISFFSRPKRQLHQQHGSSSTSSPIIFSELANKKVGRPSSPQNSTAAGKTVFTETAYPDHILTEPTFTSTSMPVTSAVSVRGRRVRAKGKGRDKTLTILGLFELTQNSLARESGRSEKIAAEMALEDINAKGILPGYRLTMHTNDTQCDPGTGVDAFFHALYAKKDSKIVSLLGTSCSEVTERLAKVATHQRIIQVSFGSTSPSLSDNKEFPLFYRTVAPVSSHAEAIIELIRHFQWDTVTFFTKNENRYTMPANFLVSELEKTNVTCKATLTFSIADYQEQLKDMKELDSRIIIANFGSDVAPLVFCEIYHLGMYGSDYAWILIGEPDIDWWQESPSPTGNRSSRSTKTRSKRTSNSQSSSYAFSSNGYSTSAEKTHFGESVSRDALSYGDQSTKTTTSDGDSISIKMGESRIFGGSRVAISESGSVVGGLSRNGSNESSTIRRLNSSSNPATLRPKSSGKSLHQLPRHQSDCSFKQLMEAVQYAIVVDRYNILEHPSDSGMTAVTFRNRLMQRLKRAYNISSNSEVSPFAPETYDAVWTVALGLRKVKENYNYTLDNFTRENVKFSQLLKTEIGKLNFSGISGPITFSGSDRIGISSFMQIQDGKMIQVGLLFPDRPTNKLELTCKGCQKIRWQGNQVPISRREFRIKLIRVEYSLYIIVATTASLGIVMAAAFLAFNLYNRKLKYIKLSSPKLNNIVIIGCMFAYLAVILLGTDFTTVPDGKHFAYICTIRAYLLAIAFSLAFGAMFAKTYRVYRIFTRSCIGVVKNKLLRDTQLMTLIMVLVLIDCIIVSSWATFDPMHVNLRNLTLQIDPSDRSVVYQPQIEVCRSQHGHVWLSVLYGYKSLLLVVGLYMAWETRHVKIQALNDSKYIGLCVYIVVLTSVLAVSLANLISERVTVSFVSVTSLILFSTTVTLCLLFLPKIHAITSYPNASDPIVESMGLKIECNTRRFIVEDTKELLFRAEVQNRVYKRQIEAVDVEIWRLENLLVYSPSKHQQTTLSATTDAVIAGKNVKGVTKDRKQKHGENGDDGESSSDENDSNSEIFTVYLHGPRFIVPISLFNFRSTTSPSTYTSARMEASLQDPTLLSASSTAPRSSWPNSRYLAPPTNGLIAKKYRFKSEPRLLAEPPERSRNVYGESANTTALSPPTIIQWGDADDEDPALRVSSAGSSNASCNNVAKNNSRKGSSTSGTGSKRSSIFSAFKNPWAYLTGFMRQPENSQGSSNTTGKFGRKDINNRGSNFYPDGTQNDNYLLKPIAYFGGQSVSSSSQRHKFSSVPDLWAVRGSPDFDVNHKKHSINSDTAAVGIYGANPSCSYELVPNNPDPVLKLIVTSHESVYL